MRATKDMPRWERVSRRLSVDESTGCWVWQGPLSPKGYARIRVDGRDEYIHRVAHEEFIGPIPEGLHIDHLCRNRACANPEHLEAVPIRTNLLRGVGVTAVNAAKTCCIRDHEFTPENTYAWRGRRYCRTCRADRMRAFFARRQAAKRAAA